MRSDVKDIEHVQIRPSSMDSDDGKMLIGELNRILTDITGDDGTAHFHKEDVETDRGAFLIAYIDGEPCGCGALRPVTEGTGEIKRIYARKNVHGVGRKIVEALEEKAAIFGYSDLILETRVQNTHAIEFYKKCGFTHRSAFGKYVGNKNSYCFEKKL